MWWSKKRIDNQGVVTSNGIVIRHQTFRIYTKRGWYGKRNREFARQLGHEMKLLLKKSRKWYRQPINNNKYARIKAI